jgi:hypothetical protein
MFVCVISLFGVQDILALVEKDSSAQRHFGTIEKDSSVSGQIGTNHSKNRGCIVSVNIIVIKQRAPVLNLHVPMWQLFYLHFRLVRVQLTSRRRPFLYFVCLFFVNI